MHLFAIGHLIVIDVIVCHKYTRNNVIDSKYLCVERKRTSLTCIPVISMRTILRCSVGNGQKCKCCCNKCGIATKYVYFIIIERISNPEKLLQGLTQDFFQGGGGWGSVCN